MKYHFNMKPSEQEWCKRTILSAIRKNYCFLSPERIRELGLKNPNPYWCDETLEERRSDALVMAAGMFHLLEFTEKPETREMVCDLLQFEMEERLDRYVNMFLQMLAAAQGDTKDKVIIRFRRKLHLVFNFFRMEAILFQQNLQNKEYYEQG